MPRNSLSVGDQLRCQEGHCQEPARDPLQNVNETNVLSCKMPPPKLEGRNCMARHWLFEPMIVCGGQVIRKVCHRYQTHHAEKRCIRRCDRARGNKIKAAGTMAAMLRTVTRGPKAACTKWS